VLDLSPTSNEQLTADLSPALRAAAASAFQQFSTLADPTEKEENWRYVDVPSGLAARQVASGAGTATPSDLEPLLEDLAGRAVIVDGFVTEFEGTHLKRLSALEAPVLPEAETPDRFAAAARAFGGDGVVITTSRGEAVARPVYVSTEATVSGMSIPRIVVHAAEASEIRVVVDQRSPDGIDALVLPDIEVQADAAARVSVTLVQRWGNETTAVGNVRMRAERDGFVELAEAGLGATFSRLHLVVDLAGRGADARITGAYFGDEEQILDYRYFMNHVGPNTTSEMFLKGAVAGTARSVFTGLIRIEPEGQGTNAHQTNRNLVLSDGAEAHSVPNLEILANDVRCGHGSAVGPLDEDQRYYLMSRGLPEDRADRLQVVGFFEEALQRFPVPEIERTLRTAAMDKYDRLAR
jgi:Fe-S cluster assembly protein SufD